MRLRNNPEQRILAIGHWGTYKRLETLMEAFPTVLENVPNAKLIIAGANHHTKAGYWESIREAQPAHLPIEFRGYVAEEAIPDLFQTTSVVVMPYDSATGSSGPAHQACEFGVPIVSADLPDFRTMADDEHMAVRFYRIGDAAELAEQLIAILQSQELQQQMSDRNFAAGLEMTMASVVDNYVRWFELQQCKRALRKGGLLSRLRLARPLSRPTTPLRSIHASASPDKHAGERTFRRPKVNSHAECRSSASADSVRTGSSSDGYQSKPMLEGDF
jgi:glycosyltransferase involved in cell wall biosynthesis